MRSEFPGKNLIRNPFIELYYQKIIDAKPQEIWPWIQQVGYHRGGWYIDTWLDKFEQKYLWPNLVPKEARGIYKQSANDILPKYQNIKNGDQIPDGPPGSAYYWAVKVDINKLLLLYANSHFKYMAPQFVYKTKYAPKGAFCWAFILEEIDSTHTKLISWWCAEGYPKTYFILLKPLIKLIDSIHQKAILKGIIKRVNKYKNIET